MEHVDFDSRPLTDLEKDAALSALFDRRVLADRQSVVQRVRNQEPLQNPSRLTVFEDDANRRDLFIADVGKRVTINGTGHTSDYLRRTFQFTKVQSKAVIDEAKRELHAKIQGETELMRSVAIARLESIMRRAKDACDLSNEIRATKEWLRVLGVYSTEEGGLGDLAALLRELSGDQGPDPTKIVEAEFEVTEEAAKEEHWVAPQFNEFVEESPNPKIPRGRRD